MEVLPDWQSALPFLIPNAAFSRDAATFKRHFAPTAIHVAD